MTHSDAPGRSPRGLWWSGLVVCGGAAFALVPRGVAPLPTTARDFEQQGTLPGPLLDGFDRPAACATCHGNYDREVEPYRRWAGSMMAQATRDPLFQAALAIANQDARDSSYFCMRCHAPTAWVGGRALPADGSALDPALGDFDGVTCHVCHRMIDPVYDPAENPPEDPGILAALVMPTEREVHNGQYVIDPVSRIRGPFELDPRFPWHDWRSSPFHREALLCGTCHDVSNSLFNRDQDADAYHLNNYDSPHPSQDKRDEFPVERTFSEWKRSVYARAPIETGGRFGGNESAVSTCQDCHMPDTSGAAAAPGLGAEHRDDLPRHDFNGSNSWVLRAVREEHPDAETGLNGMLVDEAIARNKSMLRRAADLEAFLRDGQLVVRVVNRTAHKLPTGYHEGRRMWLHVRFLGRNGEVLAEHGRYDNGSATLSRAETRLWEAVHGLDAEMAQETGLPVGPGFHFALNNDVLFENRIPPRGYNSLAFGEIDAVPRGHDYPEEQYWDDVSFTVPEGVLQVRVQLLHQTTSREYIEFLRDENYSNDAGQRAYELWEMLGKSRPVVMASVQLHGMNAACPQPLRYGLGKATASGGRGKLGFRSTPSAAAGDFALTVSGGQSGELATLWFGDGPRSQPYQGGTLLVARPQRGPTVPFDANGRAVIPIPVDPGLAGTTRYYQVEFHDPGASFDLGLTNGLHVDFCD